MTLNIKGLKAKTEHKTEDILKGVDLQIEKGEVHALLGANASGKSTLAHTIVGNPQYSITNGSIKLEDKDITKIKPEERTKLGIAISWQNPPSLEGITLEKLLNQIKNTEDLDTNFVKELLNRNLDTKFSGGEQKIAELVQIISLNPKLVIFDEIDSGLDITKLEIVSDIIKTHLIKNGVSILIITHWGQILDFLNPSKTHIMLDGKIICNSHNHTEMINTIKKEGYDACKKCKTPKTNNIYGKKF